MLWTVMGVGLQYGMYSVHGVVQCTSSVVPVVAIILLLTVPFLSFGCGCYSFCLRPDLFSSRVVCFVWLSIHVLCMRALETSCFGMCTMPCTLGVGMNTHFQVVFAVHPLDGYEYSEHSRRKLSVRLKFSMTRCILRALDRPRLLGLIVS